jgi:hypothetical protein
MTGTSSKDEQATQFCLVESQLLRRRESSQEGDQGLIGCAKRRLQHSPELAELRDVRSKSDGVGVESQPNPPRQQGRYSVRVHVSGEGQRGRTRSCLKCGLSVPRLEQVLLLRRVGTRPIVLYRPAQMEWHVC